MMRHWNIKKTAGQVMAAADVLACPVQAIDHNVESVDDQEVSGFEAAF